MNEDGDVLGIECMAEAPAIAVPEMKVAQLDQLPCNAGDRVRRGLAVDGAVLSGRDGIELFRKEECGQAGAVVTVNLESGREAQEQRLFEGIAQAVVIGIERCGDGFGLGWLD